MRHPLTLLALAFVLVSCGKEAAPPAKVERPVLTYVVGVAGTDNGNVYSGEVRARHEAVLGFRIGGKIVERLVDAGATVRAGQVLARLDAADARLQESSADAQLHLAEDELKRNRELHKKGFVSQALLDNKETAYKAALAQAGLAHNQQAYTSLLAERSGVVAAALAETGQVVGAGQPVVRVAEDSAREVAVAIPEAHFAALKIGMPAEVEIGVEGGALRRYSGRLRELSPAADPASRTYPARFSLDNADGQAALGMTARVRLGASDKKGGQLLPLSAIFQQGDHAAVWVVAQDRSVSLRPVTVAAYRDDGVLLSGGLAAGERIVGAGVHKLTAGEKIKLIENGLAR